jgi:polynucleotide 5'-triphosphatase
MSQVSYDRISASSAIWFTHVFQAQHQHFNVLLNRLKEASDKPGHHSTPIAYTHSHLVDSFYPSENPRDRDKIRVTRNDKTGEVVATVKKVRLGNLDIYSPKRAADWRISVNIEVPGAYHYFCCST